LGFTFPLEEKFETLITFLWTPEAARHEFLGGINEKSKYGATFEIAANSDS